MSLFAAKVHNSDHIRYGSRIKIPLSPLRTINKVMPQKKNTLNQKKRTRNFVGNRIVRNFAPDFSDNQSKNI
jgi:hypothetical protein